MIKDHKFLNAKASFCLDIAKKLGATDASVTIGHGVSETVNFRNKKLDESNRSDDLAFSIDTYIGKKKSSISSSNASIIFFAIGLDLVIPYRERWSSTVKPSFFDRVKSKGSPPISES